MPFQRGQFSLFFAGFWESQFQRAICRSCLNTILCLSILPLHCLAGGLAPAIYWILVTIKAVFNSVSALAPVWAIIFPTQSEIRAIVHTLAVLSQPVGFLFLLFDSLNQGQYRVRPRCRDILCVSPAIKMATNEVLVSILMYPYLIYSS